MPTPVLLTRTLYDKSRVFAASSDRDLFRSLRVGRDAQVMDWFTRLVPERAMAQIADRMASPLQR